MDTPPFKKLRSLCLSSPHQFLLTPTNLTIINDNSFTVLNSLPLKTIFYKNSEILKNVKKVVKLGEFDLIINDFNIFFTRRGEIDFTKTYEEKIIDIETNSDFVFIQFETSLKIFIANEEKFRNYEFEYITEINEPIHKFLVPKYYKEKIIYSKGNKLILFNFIKNQIVFETELQENIELITTFYKNILSIATNMNKVLMFDLKKGKTVFDLKFAEKIKNISYSTNEEIAVLSDKLYLIDLRSQNIFYKIDNVNWMEFQNEKLFINFSNESENGIKIFDIENKKPVIYNQRVFPGNIKEIKYLDGKNFALKGTNDIFNVFLYNDSRNFKYKNSSKIQNFDEIKVTKKGIVTGNNKLGKLDFENKRIENIINCYKENIIASNISECGNVALICFDTRIVLIDFSEIILKEIFYKKYLKKENEKILDLNCSIFREILVFATENTIYNYSLKKNSVEILKIENKIEKMEIVSNFILIKTQNDKLMFYDIKNNLIAKKFPEAQKYCISSDLRTLICYKNKICKIYGIDSGELQNKFGIEELNDLKLSKNGDLLLVCYKNGNLGLYSNTEWLSSQNIVKLTDIEEKEEKEVDYKTFEKKIVKPLSYLIFNDD